MWLFVMWMITLIFTLNDKLMLNENLGGNLDGTQY